MTPREQVIDAIARILDRATERQLGCVYQFVLHLVRQ